MLATNQKIAAYFLQACQFREENLLAVNSSCLLQFSFSLRLCVLLLSILFLIWYGIFCISISNRRIICTPVHTVQYTVSIFTHHNNEGIKSNINTVDRTLWSSLLCIALFLDHDGEYRSRWNDEAFAGRRS